MASVNLFVPLWAVPLVHDARFKLNCPEGLPDAYWQAVSVEVERVERGIAVQDLGLVVGHAKCLVEAIAKVALEIGGEPAPPNAKFQAVVSGAHRRLDGQPGDGLAQNGEMGMVTKQGLNMALSLGEVRNDFGSGHGRSQLPRVEPEVAELALEGAFMWPRWALRRLVPFMAGRANVLVDNLREHTWRRGQLAARLVEARLAEQTEAECRTIGVAVGRRAATGTFTVEADGVDRPGADPDLRRWPGPYRLGVAHGLLFAADEQCTATLTRVLLAARVIAVVPDAADEVAELFEAVVSRTPRGLSRHAELNRAAASRELKTLAQDGYMPREASDALAEHMLRDPE